jgi:pimeloyl-ACP methyl ester carboxylesterase
MTFTKQEIRLPSGPMSYWSAGEGRPLLYLHAAGGIQFSKPLEALARNHRVIMPVFPGFEGTPPHPSIDSMAGLADLVAAFHAQIVGKPCDVMSESFGGWVALWLAIQHPDLVEQLVLECPAGFMIKGGGLPNDPQEIFRMLYAHPEKIPPMTKSPAELAANATAPRRYLKSFHAEDMIARLGEVKARTLILVGTLDRLVPKEGMQLLKQKVARSHLHYVYDSAHVIEVDQPERFLHLVKSFLERGEAYIVNFGAEEAAAPAP